MFLPLKNAPRDYAWGAPGSISQLLGTSGACTLDDADWDGVPQAELWLGTHPGAPSRIVDPESVGGAATLDAWIAQEPVAALGRYAMGLREGDGPGLPYLLKVLSAAAPLSLQVHPTLADARRGFERENAAGVPLDAPERNYKDPLHKPEMLLALSDTMDALAGFRDFAEVAELVADFEARAAGDPALAATERAALADFAARVASLSTSDSLRELVTALLEGGEVVEQLVAAVSRVALAGDEAGAQGERFARERSIIATLARMYPGDPGVALALLLNHITIRRGEAIFLPAGNMHAYVRGLGIEIMAASDNVLRGGLTPKHIDIPELLARLDFAPVPPPYIAATRIQDGVEEYRPEIPDFRLVRVVPGHEETARTIHLDGPTILLCLDGEARLEGAKSASTISAGQSFFVTADELPVRVLGSVDLFAAGPGLDRRDTVPMRHAD
ncbi:mannose-6-phosphate isomerase, class I [Pseudoclavibacter helvolus]|uniref:mannose-6-phosphate isomerase, class I n=1 Tax=Pseudoclavibacter helvolus TaxID=255205 RepID=UPI003C75E904